jgi:hypothetical protein
VLTLLDAFNQPGRRAQFILDVVFGIATFGEHAPVRLAYF